MKLKVSNKAYDIGKYVAQVALPAVATFYVAVAAIWGIPRVTEVVGTITAADTLLGALLLLSNAQYQKAVATKPRPKRKAAPVAEQDH